MSGRPLRFLVAALIGWTGLRVAILWHVEIPVISLKLAPPAKAASLELQPVSPPHPVIVTTRFAKAPVPIRRSAREATMLSTATLRATPDPDYAAPATLSLMSIVSPRYLDSAAPQLTPPVPGGRRMPRPTGSRWSASAWLLLRDGRAPAAGLGGGQLGGGQGGVRIAYAIGGARRVALVARIVSPVTGKGREATLGVEWQPTKLPIRLVAERRFSLDGGRGGPAVGVVGGSGPAPLALGFDLETYGQAGVIWRDRTEPFADGAARLTRRVTAIGKAKVELGLGVWGGAQRGAQRLDLGPTLGVRLPVGGKTIRLALDWRRRVAGRARPNSGPALSIGSDF